MRAAILDLNNNVPNRSITYLRKMMQDFGVDYQLFDVRGKNEVPDAGFDCYISSGGPGSPYDREGGWGDAYFRWIETIRDYNADPANARKKYVFFICHSFQLACMHFQIGEVTNRGVKSFGTFPAYKTDAGESEPFLSELPNPFWIADFRDWQVTGADENALRDQGFKIIAIERPRKNPAYPRALMAIRFSKEMFGTQFHPEADADGMLHHFQEREKRLQLIEEQGMEKYLSMISDLEDPFKIELTFKSVLPAFMHQALNAQFATNHFSL